MKEKLSPFRSVSYIVVLSVSIWLLHHLHYEFAKTSIDHPHDIVLIYGDVPSDSWKNDERDEGFGIHRLLFGKRDQLNEKKSQVQTRKTTGNISSVDTLVSMVARDSVVENDFYQESESDAVFFSKIISNYLNQQNHELPLIRYYPKSDDGEVVYGLQKYGFYIHERPSNILSKFGSNAIYFGDSVSREDILIVSYHLISNGLKIQKIAPSRYHDDWKYKSVEIGTDTATWSDELITIPELRASWSTP